MHQMAILKPQKFEKKFLGAYPRLATSRLLLILSAEHGRAVERARGLDERSTCNKSRRTLDPHDASDY